MATPDRADGTVHLPAQTLTSRDGEPDSRLRLALIVTVGSFLIVSLLIVVIVVLAAFSNGANGTAAPAVQMAEKIFTVLLPVLAGWVSTVLTFYFQSRALDRTQDSLENAVRRVGAPGSDATTVSVREKMIPMASIRGAYDLTVTPPDKIAISELQTRLGPETGNSRLIFHEALVFRHVLHVSELNRYIASLSQDERGQTQTFADFLQDTARLDQVSRKVAFVEPAASLAAARSALDAVSGAQDIIVTANGKPDSAMQGWLTNVDLLKAFG